MVVQVPSVTCAHDDCEFLAATIKSFLPAGPVTVVVSKIPWHGEQGDWERTATLATEAGADVVLGSYENEGVHREAALDLMKSRGHDYVFIPDGDEVISPELLEACLRQASAKTADLVRVRVDTYWKSPDYVIRPMESFAPVIMLDVERCSHDHLREFHHKTSILLGPDHGILHHLSYAGSEERIERKVSTWSHREEVVPEWLDHIWRAWDADKFITNLHPTHPQAYGWTERILRPSQLEDVPSKRQLSSEPPLPKAWPKISVVIPLHGGEEDIFLCLSSLEKCSDLLHEVIVSDDASPDAAAKVAKKFKFVRLIKSKKAGGFAEACNAGAKIATGDVLLFLNSDTILPRSGLIRLIESLEASGSIGAAGPMSNAASYHQGTPAHYTALDTIDLFATDFANRDVPDEDVPMLVGVCLAVRRNCWEEVGPFCTDFGRGFFEDNDLVYRILRAGYRLRLSTRSFVHHKGSASMRRADFDAESLLLENQKKYRWKWFDDIDTGFASALSGDDRRPIHFDQNRNPARVAAECEQRRNTCGISLTMIVKNEERVLAQCLESAVRFFPQVVIVDTGSTDKTVSIAKSYGAQVIESSWKDSFATARNESLAAAIHPWVFWIDADDVLPVKTVEQVQLAAMNAAPDVSGFVVPVQFTDQGPGAGTRVDHLKLFRNLPGLQWEGRIHEQIVPNLRAMGGQFGRLDAVVLHSGYDTSEAGQAAKRARDFPLLELDLQERPDHPFPQFNMGMTLYHVGKQSEAIPFLHNSIALAGPTDSHLRKSFALLAASHLALNRRQEAFEALNRGLAMVPNDAELLYMRGKFFVEEGQRELALKDLLAIQPEDDGFRSLDIGLLTVGRDHLLRELLK